MSKAIFVLFLTFLTVLCLQDASALNCYKCSSLAGMNQPCEVDPSTGETETCAEGQTQCVSLQTGGLFRPSILSRHCAPAGFCDTISIGSSIFRKVELCKPCDTDLCISA